MPLAAGMEGLRLIRLQGNPVNGRSRDYDRAFELWRDVWQATFRELEGTSRVKSDDFTRQDEILALFVGDRCMALVCHRYVDPSNPAVFDDSYFHPWTPQAREALKRGPVLVVGSQITIAPEFRGRGTGFSVKDTIVFCSLAHLRRQNVDSIAGFMRADKGMNTLFYACGAQPLERDLVFHGVRSDLVAFFPKSHPIRLPAEAEPGIERLLAML